jgi:hypothetical protein
MSLYRTPTMDGEVPHGNKYKCARRHSPTDQRTLRGRCSGGGGRYTHAPFAPVVCYPVLASNLGVAMPLTKSGATAVTWYFVATIATTPTVLSRAPISR